MAIRHRSAVVGLFFFGSGLAALIYQVAWMRVAGLVMGNTTAATGTVVAVFMGGLALGSFIVGRHMRIRAAAGRPLDLLRLYGRLEIAIGLIGVAIPFAFEIAGALVGRLYESMTAFAVARAVVCVLVLLPPTVLMGATLPLLVQHLTFAGSGAAQAAGRLYAVNSLGAAVGALLGGWILIPSAGLKLAAAGAALINVSIGLLACRMAWESAPGGTDGPPEPHAREPLDGPATAAVAGYALSGFSALVYEMAWTRALTMTLGSTVHAFTFILVAFIGGLALGSWLFSRWSPDRTRALAAVGVIQLALGIWGGALSWLFDRFPLLMVGFIDRWSGDFASYQAFQLGASMACVLLPCVLMGGLLPLVLNVVIRDRRNAGAGTAVVYAWNTVFCILGSVVASYVLIPILGLDVSMRAAATVNLLAAGALAAVSAMRPVRKGIALAAATATAVGLVLLPPWDMAIASSGVFLYGKDIRREAAEARLSVRDHLAREGTVEAAYWDSYGLVTVHRKGPGSVWLKVNGKVDASSHYRDMMTQSAVGHIPCILHPEPKDVLVIGLGCGITIAEVLQHDVRSVDCVEISPAMVKGASHFDAVTRRALHDPRYRLILNDGRAHMRYAGRQYDVVISQPSNVWVSGMAVLFTREYFADARARLRPGGLFGLWVQAYRMDPRDFLAILGTLCSVFPEVSVWETAPGSDYLLVGREAGAPQEYGRVTDRIKARLARGGLSEVGLLRPEDFMGQLLLTPEGTRRLRKDGPSITDDDCWLEYTAPRAMHQDHRRAILELMNADPGEAAEWLEGGPPGKKAELRRVARARRLLAEARTAAGPKPLSEAARLFDQALAECPEDGLVRLFVEQTARDALETLRKHRANKAYQIALNALSGLPSRSRRYPEAMWEAGNTLMLMEQFEPAANHYARGLKADGWYENCALGYTQALLKQARTPEAVASAERTLSRHPTSTAAHHVLALAYQKAGRRDDAQKAIAFVLARDPRNLEARKLKAELDKP